MNQTNNTIQFSQFAAVSKDSDEVLGKILYYTLSSILIDREVLARLCDTVDFPYKPIRRSSLADAFRSATGDIYHRLVVKDAGVPQIINVYCRDNRGPKGIISRELVKETLHEDTLPLSGLFESAPEDGRVQHMELAVQILRDDGSGGGIDQYVRFCQISDEMRGRHGATLKAVQETLRECVRQNILAPFLLTREKEVSDIMISLFNQEEIQAIHDYNVAKQAQETALKQTVLLMRDLGVAREEAVRQLAKRYDLLQNDAETAVRQYWTI